MRWRDAPTGGVRLNVLEFTLLVWISSATAGFLGALTGLGGGVVLVPLLTLVFGVDIRYAIGASLVSVIATSSGAASAYVKEGYTNLRLGMFLEVATTFGAIAGATIAAFVSTRILAVVFGFVLLYSAHLSRQSRPEHSADTPPDRLATRLKLNSTYPTQSGEQPYNVHAVPVGFSLMFVAGVFSGLLGIGSGALKVLAMDQFMRIPFKVSTTTSNFMIGVTAAASAGVYLKRGYIDPGLAMPVMLGVLLGALLGAKVLVKARVGVLRNIFSLVIVLLAIQMIFNGFIGRI
ncbi:permease [Nostoc cycadae WK-1]|uniref:Probable membrane transporter protein n=1 Tax=Nostoc cycadae WK-1 TaxID=1861711 RepID=A0A2H6LKP9_9NOSO|nr:permease [Nostoc cycadae WK-1]